jgi:hypothetical protein
MELRKIDTNWAIICAAMRQQTSFPLPSVPPFRIMMYCWLLACLVLTSGYSGCLYSLMTVPPKMKNIDTITELANAQSNGQIQVIASKGSTYFSALKVCILYIFKSYQSLWNSKEPFDSKIFIDFYMIFKSANSGIHQELGKFLEPVASKSVGLDFVRNSTNSYAFISSRDHLVDGMLRFGEKSFHLPPLSDESSLFLDIMAIALPKRCRIVKEINYL